MTAIIRVTKKHFFIFLLLFISVLLIDEPGINHGIQKNSATLSE